MKGDQNETVFGLKQVKGRLRMTEKDIEQGNLASKLNQANVNTKPLPSGADRRLLQKLQPSSLTSSLSQGDSTHTTARLKLHGNRQIKTSL